MTFPSLSISFPICTGCHEKLMSPCSKALLLSLLRPGGGAWILLIRCHYIYPVLSWQANHKPINKDFLVAHKCIKYELHLAQAPCQRGGQGLFCRSLTGVKVMGSKGTPAALWHQVLSLPPHNILGTGPQWPLWVLTSPAW